MAKKQRINWDDVAWTPFERCALSESTPPDLRKMHEEQGILTFRNSIYQVEVRGVLVPPPFGKAVWLSFKTLDKQPRHDWREMQRLKDELVGEAVESVELYPSEERLVDTSNQYHLWCFPNLEFPDHRFPFGYRERLLAEGSAPGIATTGLGARQRDFRAEFKPPDVVRIEQLKKLSLAQREAVGGRCPVDWSPLVYRGEAFEADHGGKKVKMQKLECLKENHTLFIAHKADVDEAEKT
jgi:hypothetical protein